MRVKRWLLLAFVTSLDLLSRQCQPLDPFPGEYGHAVWFGIVWFGLVWCPLAYWAVMSRQSQLLDPPPGKYRVVLCSLGDPPGHNFYLEILNLSPSF